MLWPELEVKCLCFSRVLCSLVTYQKQSQNYVFIASQAKQLGNFSEWSMNRHLSLTVMVFLLCVSAFWIGQYVGKNASCNPRLMWGNPWLSVVTCPSSRWTYGDCIKVLNLFDTISCRKCRNSGDQYASFYLRNCCVMHTIHLFDTILFLFLFDTNRGNSKGNQEIDRYEGPY
jgi:hypothetical protein